MAMQICKVCGERFRHDLVGRPPSTCPTHRNMRTAAKKTAKVFDTQGDEWKVKEQETETVTGITEDGDIRPNKFKGTCHLCGLQIEAGEGELHKVTTDQPSKVFHAGCWSTYRATSATEHAAKVEEATTLINKGDTNAAMDALKALAESLAPKIDEDAIRAIVDSAIGNGLSEERINSLIVKAGVQRIELSINGEVKELPKTHHNLLPAIVARLGCGIPGKRLNIFLPGPAGSGKSTVVMQAAEIMGLNFASMSLGPTTPTSKFFGYMDATGRFIETDFYRIYKDGGVFLIDEMDNGHPGLLAELNQALANPTCAFAIGMVPKHPEFRCVATGNTFGKGGSRLFIGRNMLDAATLDRFVIKNFPIDETMEANAAMAFSIEETDKAVARYIALVQSVRAKIDKAELQIVVSPRASIDGAMMIAAGIPMDEVIEERLIPGMALDTRRQLDIEAAALLRFMEEV